MAQSLKHSTVDFRSGYDLRVLRWSPALGFMLSGETASFLLPLPLPLSLLVLFLINL